MDPQVRKKTLRRLTNGMYILTSRFEQEYGAATVTWISQISFKPPLLMAAVRPDSSVFKCLSRSRIAAIHILSAADQGMAQKFFSPTHVAGAEINGEPFTTGRLSAPVLTNAPTYVECQVSRILESGGDHALVVLEVVEARNGPDARALTINDSPWEYGG